MTQPAKVQEPSMEEILASIRRIIADDEAKPPAAEKPASPAAAREAGEAGRAGSQGARHERHSSVGDSRCAGRRCEGGTAARQTRAGPGPEACGAGSGASTSTAVSNKARTTSMRMLNGLDEATTPEEIRPPAADGEVFELTDDMAVPDAPQPSFQKVEPQDDLEFTENAAAKAPYRQPAFEPPPFESAAPPQQILSHSTVSAVESAFNSARPHRAEQQRADAGRSGQGNAAADAEILARRQFAGAGGAHRQGGNRTGFARRALAPFSKHAASGLPRGNAQTRRCSKYGFSGLPQAGPAAPNSATTTDFIVLLPAWRVDLARSGGFLASITSPIASP